MAHLQLVWDFMRPHLIDILVDYDCLGALWTHDLKECFDFP